MSLLLLNRNGFNYKLIILFCNFSKTLRAVIEIYIHTTIHRKNIQQPDATIFQLKLCNYSELF